MTILVDERIDKVLTQYRESPKLLFMLKTYLEAILETSDRITTLPSLMDIRTANGDQLDLIGKILGWGRCHCVCDVQTTFGFDCLDGSLIEYVAGFCDEGVTWIDCGTSGVGEVCINDDEIYRKFLLVRRYQMTSQFGTEPLNECVKILFEDQAVVLDQGSGRIVIAPNRELTNSEQALLQLYPRVIPVALGVTVKFHFFDSSVFGFGVGWGGFCDIVSSDESIETELGLLSTSEGDLITTGNIEYDAPWMCEFDVKPYSC